MAPTGSSSPFTPCRIITLTIILLVISLSLLQNQILSIVHSLAKPRVCTPAPATYSPSDTNPSTPTLRHISNTFREQKHLEDLSQEADAAWHAALSTPKGGFLFVKNENKEERGGQDEPWGVSMFHGIHCLTLLRSAYQHATNKTTMDVPKHHGIRNSEQGNELDSDGHTYDPFDITHVGHCFSYIAQYIMCAADSTIEPPVKQYDDSGKLVDFHVDGEGYQHSCRDPALLWRTVMNSETEAVRPFDWAKGDTVESVFGR